MLIARIWSGFSCHYEIGVFSIYLKHYVVTFQSITHCVCVQYGLMFEGMFNLVIHALRVHIPNLMIVRVR